ncbi:MAG: formate hydrogenlyase, partial [Betaproteobacteria bacterium HGW-Betaproteobacteria-14]
MSASGLFWQIFSIFLAMALAPLLTGWVNQCRAWLQNRSAPPLLQPYYMLHK